MNKIDYTNAAYAPLLLEQEHCKKNTFKELYRVITLTQKELFDVGYDDEQVQYVGDKWGGKYLRAPEIYYTILDKGKNKLIPLREIAEVQYGLKTGANEFFYLDIEAQEEWKIEAEYLVPIFKSPKESFSIQIEPAKLSLKLFNCHKSKVDLNGTNALKYIEWGEKSRVDFEGKEIGKFNERPSCRGRINWYDVGKRKFAQVILPKGLNDSFRFFKNNNILADCRLYELFSDKVDLANRMNSTLATFNIEVTSRQGLGDGLLEIFVYEVPYYLIPNFNIEINNSFLLRKQESIFKELGFNRTEPIREQQPNPLPDRKELDDLIFDELGLSQVERNEVYWSLAELVKQRLDKAASR